jgi:DNA polymerase (family 10)
VLDLARAGGLAKAAGIEPIAGEHAQTIVTEGPLALLQPALTRIPDELHRLVVSAGLPLETVATLYRQLGVTTRTELQAVLREGLLDERVPANAQIARALRRGLAPTGAPDAPADAEGVPLGRAWRIVLPVLDALRKNSADGEEVEAVGGLRRVDPLVAEITLLGSAADPRAMLTALVDLPGVSEILHRSRHKASVLIDDSQVDLKVVPKPARGLAQLWSTGTEAHLAKLVDHARSKGLTLRSTGVFRSGEPVTSACESDAEIYATLGLSQIAPELRVGQDEVEVAAAGGLPDLVSVGDVRGDLHMHSDWSDGQDPIEAMAEAAQALGYEYIAITDHSPHAETRRAVDPARLRRQAAEIERVRARLPQLTILHGVEVDIMPDGTLDLDDATLQELDLVVASLHDRAGHSGEELTARCLAALRHPLVNILAHPTNRLVGHRAGYELDLDAVFATAKSTGTILEIDGAPIHLDMDGAVARRAAATGAMISVDSDSHRASRLGAQMWYGVGTARRGWLRADQVVNTQPVTAIREILARKRANA